MSRRPEQSPLENHPESEETRAEKREPGGDGWDEVREAMERAEGEDWTTIN